MRGEDVIELLRAGNRRFVTGEVGPRDLPVERRRVVARHAPVAVVVACSDARVPAEAVFDVPVGTLFVVRTAGHVLDEVAIASIRYATETLDAPTVVVLGHECCGAVTAAVKGGAPAWLDPVLRPIRSVRDRTGVVGDITTVTVAHVHETVAALRQALADDAEHDEPPMVTGGLYRLDSGEVDWLE